MTEAPETRNDSTSDGLLAAVSNVHLVWGWVGATVAASALFWLSTWLLYDYMPSFEDTVGAVMAETSRGLFVGAGLVGVLLALRAVRKLRRSD